MIKVGDFLYRYEDVRFAGPLDENENLKEFPNRKYEIHIRLLRMRVIKLQPKSVTVNYYGESKRILMTARNPWARPTPEEALTSYKIRKNNQASFLSNQLQEVQRILNKLNGGHLSNIKDIEEVEV